MQTRRGCFCAIGHLVGWVFIFSQLWCLNVWWLGKKQIMLVLWQLSKGIVGNAGNYSLKEKMSQVEEEQVYLKIFHSIQNLTITATNIPGQIFSFNKCDDELSQWPFWTSHCGAITSSSTAIKGNPVHLLWGYWLIIKGWTLTWIGSEGSGSFLHD